MPYLGDTATGKSTVNNVAIDPNNWILKGATIQQIAAEPVILATGENPLLRVFPGNDLLTAQFTTQTAGLLTISLVNLLGQPGISYSGENDYQRWPDVPKVWSWAFRSMKKIWQEVVAM